MRLSFRNLIVTFALMVPILSLAGWLWFLNVRSLVKEEAEERLVARQARMEAVAGKLPLSTGAAPDGGSHISSFDGSPANHTMQEVMRMDEELGEELPYLECAFVVQDITGQEYLVKLWEPLLEEDDLWESVGSGLLMVLGGVLLALLLASWITGRWVWKPFRATLAHVRNLNLDGMSSPLPKQTGTKEFNDLNAAVNGMEAQMRADYTQAKEFSGHAAHEMQTPLAVALAITDDLMQGKMEEGQAMQLAELQTSIQRMAKLHGALLLLSRLGRRVEPTPPLTDVAPLCKMAVEELSALAKTKGTKINSEIEAPAMTVVPEELALMVVRNLLLNALRHGTGDEVRLTLALGRLTVDNEGPAEPLNLEQMVQPFKKAAQDSPGFGLGLSIVKRIADAHGLRLAYAYREGWHCFSFHFEREKT